MRKFLLVLTVVIVALVVVYRNRLFLWDPLGKLERNGAQVSGARVFINYSNDVLVQEDGGRRMFLVQNWNRLPGTPDRLNCIQFLLCLTTSDQAIPGAPQPGQAAEMSNREVSFTDSEGSHVHIQIR